MKTTNEATIGTLAHPEYVTYYAEGLQSREGHDHDQYNIAGCPMKHWIKRVVDKGDTKYFNTVVDLVADAKVKGSSKGLRENGIHIDNNAEYFIINVLDHCFSQGFVDEKSASYLFVEKIANAIADIYKHPKDESGLSTTLRHLKTYIELACTDENYTRGKHNALAITKAVLKACEKSSVYRAEWVGIGKKERAPKDPEAFSELISHYGETHPQEDLMSYYINPDAKKPSEQAVAFVGIVRDVLGERGIRALSSETQRQIDEYKYGSFERISAIRFSKAIKEEDARSKNPPVPEGALQFETVSFLPPGYFGACTKNQTPAKARQN